MRTMLAATAMMAIAGAAAAAPVLRTSDFIANATRTGFNGFESSVLFPGTDASHTEGGITATAVAATIWTGLVNWGAEGGRAWAHDGATLGFTRITLASGADFWDVGFLIGHGNGGTFARYVYDLRRDGVQVLFGMLDGTRGQYLGFSGGGFDEIRVIGAGSAFAGGFVGLRDVSGGSAQAIAIDSVEVRALAIPAPPALGLLAVGLLGMRLVRGRAKG